VLSYFQAIVIGLLQGVSELFPVSSLGHSVLVPALFGWHNLVGAESANESFYLAFLVGLHVATALALVVYFRRDWIRIVGGMIRSLRTRRIDTPDAGWAGCWWRPPSPSASPACSSSIRCARSSPSRWRRASSSCSTA
jgi:undecaprenyl-diphosphatase